MHVQKVVRVQPADAAAPAAALRPGMSRASYPQAPMVAWYEPLQLLRTGISVAVSTILERNSDQRIVEALETDPIEYFDYSVDDAKQPRRELWLDYVADAGDGFNSTYAVASAVLHHYRRHSDGFDHHKIVAGGGGAFRHPTHPKATPPRLIEPPIVIRAASAKAPEGRAP